MASTGQHSQVTGSWDEGMPCPRADEEDEQASYVDDECERSSWFISCLARTIESEIIPRLMLAHRTPVARECDGDVDAAPSSDDVAELARLAIRHEADVAVAFLDAVMGRGVPLESLLLELLAPAARHLGELWNEDLCDFTDVTIGLGRLHQALHAFTRAPGSEPSKRQISRKALLATVPGEQHTFGVAMVAEFFRQARWDVFCETGADEQSLLAAVRNEHFDLVGLSVASSLRLAAVTKLIADVQQQSCNRRILVMVGGQAIIEDPTRGAQVGADTTALDGRLAVLQTQQLLGILPAVSTPG